MKKSDVMFGVNMAPLVIGKVIREHMPMGICEGMTDLSIGELAIDLLQVDTCIKESEAEYPIFVRHLIKEATKVNADIFRGFTDNDIREVAGEDGVALAVKNLVENIVSKTSPAKSLSLKITKMVDNENDKAEEEHEKNETRIDDLFGTNDAFGDDSDNDTGDVVDEEEEATEVEEDDDIDDTEEELEEEEEAPEEDDDDDDTIGESKKIGGKSKTEKKRSKDIAKNIYNTILGKLSASNRDKEAIKNAKALRKAMVKDDLPLNSIILINNSATSLFQELSVVDNVLEALDNPKTPLSLAWSRLIDGASSFNKEFAQLIARAFMPTLLDSACKTNTDKKKLNEVFKRITSVLPVASVSSLVNNCLSKLKIGEGILDADTYSLANCNPIAKKYNNIKLYRPKLDGLYNKIEDNMIDHSLGRTEDVQDIAKDVKRKAELVYAMHIICKSLGLCKTSDSELVRSTTCSK